MLYKLLVFIHILSAILGMGPGFILTFIVTKVSNMTELRHAFKLRKRLHVFVMSGGMLLLVTGLWLGLLNPYLFAAGWYVLSLTLFIVALAFGPLLLAPLSKPINAILETHQGEEIPDSYYAAARKLFLTERIENGIFIVIIVLMITKPF